MQDNLSVLSVELQPLHERLVAIRRKLVGLAAKGGLVKAELKPLQEELRKIDSLSTIRFRFKFAVLMLYFRLCHNFLPLDAFHTRKQLVGNVLTESSSVLAAIFPRHKPSVPHFWKNASI